MTLKPFGPDPSRLVPDAHRARIEAQLLMERVLLFPGLRMTEDPAHSPKKTGQLIGSTKVERPRWSEDTLEGALLVGIEYGRFQEYRHPTKSLYMQRAIAAAEAELRRRLEGNEVLRSLGLGVGTERVGA